MAMSDEFNSLPDDATDEGFEFEADDESVDDAYPETDEDFDASDDSEDRVNFHEVQSVEQGIVSGNIEPDDVPRPEPHPDEEVEDAAAPLEEPELADGPNHVVEEGERADGDQFQVRPPAGDDFVDWSHRA